MSSAKPTNIDSFDCKILTIIQESNRTTSDQIAEEIGLSPAAVQRRIKRMRQQNVIRADISVVSPRTVDRDVTLVVEVYLESERTDLLDSFKKKMKANPAVQQCYYVTGSSDFILIVTAKDMEDYEQFTRQAFFDNPNIRRFRTNVVMDPVKVGLSVPVTVTD